MRALPKQMIVSSLVAALCGCAGPVDETASTEEALVQSFSFFGNSTPAQINQTDGPQANYELGFRFTTSSAGQLTAARYYRSPAERGPHTARLWLASTGRLIASVPFKGETASGWQKQAFAIPVALTVGAEYELSVNTGGTYYVDTYDVLGTAVTSGPLQTVAGNNGVYGPAGSLPTNSYRNSNYFRDVVFTPTTTTTPQPIIVLAWDDGSADETGFVLERKTGTTGTFAGLATLAANAVTYTDATGVAGQEYCYRVKAVNAAGESPYTTEVCSTPRAP